jgi:tetratricopeptide (TPR) repeat protein
MIRNALLVIALGISFQSIAQNANDALINAFTESYKQEAAKDYDKAIKALKTAGAENLYEANVRMGWLYYSKKDYVQSSRAYQAALNLKPKSIDAALGYVNAEAGLQNWDNVFEAYKKILTNDPNNSTANYRIALMYFYRKDYVNAQVYLQHVLDLYPFDYDSMLLMAQTKAAAGKLTEAKTWYEKVLLYNPSDNAIKKLLSKM